MAGMSTTVAADSGINISVSFDRSSDPIELYLSNFENLAKHEKWDEIIIQGAEALSETQKLKQKLSMDEAKINAQLTSTNFYKGNFEQALVHANRCRELSAEFEDKSLFLRSLYLESAIYRAQAGNEKNAQNSLKLFAKAVQTAEEALDLYGTYGLEDFNLNGKIWFNLGAAHADNPSGNLAGALEAYAQAKDSFTLANASDDIIRTSIRQGKIYLLKSDFKAAQAIIDEVRSQSVQKERILMQADYLESQLKFAMHEGDEGMRIARNGLSRAQVLGAKQDEERFLALLKIGKC